MVEQVESFKRKYKGNGFNLESTFSEWLKHGKEYENKKRKDEPQSQGAAMQWWGEGHPSYESINRNSTPNISVELPKSEIIPVKFQRSNKDSAYVEGDAINDLSMASRLILKNGQNEPSETHSTQALDIMRQKLINQKELSL